MKLRPLILCMGLVPALLPAMAMASSHREAPFISSMAPVDGSDFYMFMSYEPGRQGYVTLLANYNPLQGPTGGPNFFPLDDRAFYDINVDNNGDGVADLVFRFKFHHHYRNLTVPAGGKNVAVPLLNIGPVSASDNSALNRIDSYSLDVRDVAGANKWESVVTSSGSKWKLTKPVDNIGKKSIAHYADYANHYIHDVAVPGCHMPARVFVGQRKDGFVVNVGEVFDLVNLNPLGARDSARNALSGKNVTTLALEMPASCLEKKHGDHIIGGWTTASVPQTRVIHADGSVGNSEHSRMAQVSRLGMPLVNELVIGLKDKDRFNASCPSDDAQFLKYVTNPTLPVLLNVLFKTEVPHTPRNDLVTVFLTGVPGLNQPSHVKPSEELRLNTSIPATPPAQQNDLGVLGGDMAGFPNGRRPYDDVVDIELRVAQGALCGVVGSCGDQNSDPNHGAPFTDGARAAGATGATAHATGDENPADTYIGHFPYLRPAIPGSPNGANGLAADCVT